MNKMGKPPTVVDTDGDTGKRNSGVFHTYVNDNGITYVATKSHSMLAERMILTFKGSVGQENQIEYALGGSDIPYPSHLQQQTSAFCDWTNANRTE